MIEAGAFKRMNRGVAGGDDDLRPAFLFINFLLLLLVHAATIEYNASDGPLVGEEGSSQGIVGVVGETPHAQRPVGADGRHAISARMKGGVENGKRLERTADLLGGEARGAGEDGAEDAQEGSLRRRRPEDQQTVVAAGEQQRSVVGKGAGVDKVKMAVELPDDGTFPAVDADAGHVPGGDDRLAGPGD